MNTIKLDFTFVEILSGIKQQRRKNNFKKTKKQNKKTN